MINKDLNDLLPLYKRLVYKSTNEFDVLRELIKLAYLAKAKNIEIKFSYSYYSGLCIEFSDDGTDFSLEELTNFFSVSEIIDCHNNSERIDSSLLLNCKKLEIITGSNCSPKYIASLSTSSEKHDAMFLRNGFSKYITQYDNSAHKNGTKITLYGFDLDNIYKLYTNVYHTDEQRVKKIYNYRRVEDYLLWHTHVGNTKKIFYNQYGMGEDYYDFSGCQPRISIVDEINNKTIYIDTAGIGLDELYTIKNNVTEDTNSHYPRSSNMCYSFNQYHIRKKINDEIVSFYMHGYVAGENYRRLKCNLDTDECLSDRFGLYLSKDFVPFKKSEDLINLPNSEHFKIIINSNNFILSLDRNEITNINTDEVQWILSESTKIIQNDYIPKAYSNYFKIRNEEEFEYKNNIYLTNN